MCSNGEHKHDPNLHEPVAMARDVAHTAQGSSGVNRRSESGVRQVGAQRGREHPSARKRGRQRRAVPCADRVPRTTSCIWCGCTGTRGSLGRTGTGRRAERCGRYERDSARDTSRRRPHAARQAAGSMTGRCETACTTARRKTCSPRGCGEKRATGPGSSPICEQHKRREEGRRQRESSQQQPNAAGADCPRGGRVRRRLDDVSTTIVA